MHRVIKDLAGLVPVFRLLIGKRFQILVRGFGTLARQPAQQKGSLPVC
jgi:hypothetical protein